MTDLILERTKTLSAGLSPKDTFSSPSGSHTAAGDLYLCNYGLAYISLAFTLPSIHLACPI